MRGVVQQGNGSEAGAVDDAPLQPPVAIHESVPQLESPASAGNPHTMGVSPPIRSTDPLAALDPFGSIADWASLDSAASPGAPLCPLLQTWSGDFFVRSAV